MNRERLFAELCSAAPPVPPDWTPPGITRLTRPRELGPEKVRALYTSVTGNTAESCDEAIQAYKWYKKLLADEAKKLRPMWEVEYATSRIAAVESLQ